MEDGGTIKSTIQSCGISMRKRGAYHKKPNAHEQREINEFLQTLEERDGNLRYQALIDYFRSKSSSSSFGVGHNPRSINPDGEEL